SQLYPQTQTLTREAIVADFRLSLLLLEVEALCTTHPDYMQQIVSTEQANAVMRKEGKALDACSAALLKRLAANDNGNILVIYGAGHTTGRMTPSARTEGKLPE